MAFEGLTEKLSAAFKKLRGKGRLTENDVREAMREVRLALLEADVGYKVVKDFVATVTERAVGSDVLDSLTPAQQVIKIVSEELTALMGGANAKLTFASKPPTVVMMVGLQGAGKTTNVAKLAGYFRKQGHRPLLTACDVYRPAAITQLQVVGKQLNIPVFEMGQIDPVQIAQEAVKYAGDHGNDMVFLDTAGRLHNKANLMNELAKIDRVISRELPDASRETLLVLDATTGQNAVHQAEEFNKAAELTGMHPQTLRVYESKGLVNPQRSGGNTRLYSRADIERLELINQLTDEGINLAGVVRILDMKERAEEREHENEKLRARVRQLEDELHEYKMQKKITALAPRDGSVNPEQVMRKLLGAGGDL